MVMLGAGGRRCGKTTLACALIRKHVPTFSVVGAKVTTVHEHGKTKGCPRGSDGCGVCSSLDEPFRVTDEKGALEGKDTTRLLSCGADPVRWLCVRPSHLAEGATALLEPIDAGSFIVCESNSLRKVVEPGLFIIVQRSDQEKLKPSCRAVQQQADIVVRFDGESFDFSSEDIGVRGGRWTVRRQATAIVLAGGKSRRMGRDKALLPIEGRPMIEHVIDQLRPHFTEIIISSSDPEKYAFLGLEIVPDRIPDQGPMMAIASVLARATNDINFVVPCDVPTLPIDLLYRMFRQARLGAEVVVPITDEGRYEPLFGIYGARIRGRLDRALDQGMRRIIRIYDDCETRLIAVRRGEELVNLNTVADYERIQGSSQ